MNQTENKEPVKRSAIEVYSGHCDNYLLIAPRNVQFILEFPWRKGRPDPVGFSGTVYDLLMAGF